MSLPPPVLLPPALRDPALLLRRVRRDWGGEAPLWVFGYASLIWRPEFDAVEQRPATVHGWHRALEMVSRVNRGTPERPGLVFALVSGGSCRGIVYRLDPARAEQELERLWLREMPTGVYDPRWLPCRTPQGHVAALGFTLSRASPNYTGKLGDEALLAILRDAAGRYGRTLDYVLETADGLARCGIRDREIERLVRLARAHGLAPGGHGR
ncbi:gamma-glutamylcyclotransferase [Piscinibacter sakaiensis]|uniref:glutathione-specific gamma-glutamylcyclotransferase n=1 Tax=Piscinibacter sakaiensis TaxID=1547922 RepID=A0A0K8NZC3_PISS1|nr:gamma-glutamylcyclotransferase [Piscinibacter sakaiensis]GAP35723.1 cation transport protein chaC [Piscinibacter sakaiensis]